MIFAGKDKLVKNRISNGMEYCTRYYNICSAVYGVHCDLFIIYIHRLYSILLHLLHSGSVERGNFASADRMIQQNVTCQTTSDLLPPQGHTAFFHESRDVYLVYVHG